MAVKTQTFNVGAHGRIAQDDATRATTALQICFRFVLDLRLSKSKKIRLDCSSDGAEVHTVTLPNNHPQFGYAITDSFVIVEDCNQGRF